MTKKGGFTLSIWRCATTTDTLLSAARTDDIISSGGEKLSLIEVERVILDADFITDAACIGIPHERFGEAPAAIVAPKDQTMSEADLRDRLDEHMRQHLERWKRPRLYIKVPEVPRSLAKRSKLWPRLRELIRDVRLQADDSTLTLTEYREKTASRDSTT